MPSFSPGSDRHWSDTTFSRIDFDDTYDGLGDQLDETNDDLNDDTFGGASGQLQESVGKDFDFFGSTAKVSNAISEEQVRYTMQQAPPKSMTSMVASPATRDDRPARSGYEKYQNMEHVSDLQVDPNLWGAPTQSSRSQSPSNTHQNAPSAPREKKMLSLEEVEAQFRSQTAASATTYSEQKEYQAPLAQGAPSRVPQQTSFASPRTPPVHFQESHSIGSQHPTAPQRTNQHQVPQAELPATVARAPQEIQHPHQPRTSLAEAGDSVTAIRTSQDHQLRQQTPETRLPPTGQGQQKPPQAGAGGLPPQHIITHPQQLMQLSEEDRAAFLVEDAKRAKRNHKIFLLSKDNGLMTPSDKNFIGRIQLQQLLTATGSTNDQDPNAMLAEDFYYQVHSQIRGGPRQNPHQPLNHFAQTYLFQTGGRHGAFNRRNNRGDNHIQRMEQQVQRAVDAAKLKPKNKQLVIEGSLGKISFSNAKTPKPLLNIKRHESGDVLHRQQGAGRAATSRKAQAELSSSDRKSTLRNIEAIYTTLMKIEDEARNEPPPPTEEVDAATIQHHMEWRHGMKELNEKLWRELKVLDSNDHGSAASHPFISILSYPKGKKAIPRVFRHMSSEQRVTMLTMIVINLDILDVVRDGQLRHGETQLPAAAREAIDLFSAAVTPSLFAYVSEAPLFHVIGLLGLINDRVNVQSVARTRVGLSILTMLTSRATLVREAGGTEEQEWQQWSQCYNQLFDTLEPVLGAIFPGSVNSGEDMYVWQFLAAIGSGASPEQQQRLVIAVK